MVIRLAGQELKLLPQKAALLVETGTLLVADMHVGKAMHFRKSGFALPAGYGSRDFQVLAELIETHRATEVIFLGDLFHSHENVEWVELQAFIAGYDRVRFALVPGNHDRFSARFRTSVSLELLPECYETGPFLLTHAPLPAVPPGFYNLCGHIHPGVSLSGKGRMQATLPCFWFGAQTGVLPAFGNLTGLAPVKPLAGDRVVIVADGTCIEL